jgi:hypothetical protein
MKWFLALLGLLLPAAVAPVDIYPAQPTGIGIEWAAEQPPEMATVTKTVAASGADYTTIAAALAWFVSNHDFDTDGIARILITDATSYTISSALSLTGISGTPDIDGHLEITSDAANPFAGPTINMTHGSNGGFYLDMEYIYIHNLTFHLNNTNASTECIRVASGVDNWLISRNVFIALQQTTDQDGIYAGNWSTSGSVDNNKFVGFARAAIHAQQHQNLGTTQTWNIDHCSIADYHLSGETDGGGIGLDRTHSLPLYNLNIYNTLIYNHSGESASNNYNELASNSTVNYTGSNNIAEDASAESKFTSSYDSVIFIESAPSSGENAWITEIDSTTETDIDLSIAGENAYTVTGNGVDRTGSEPDPRQDFSIDIMGNARHATTPDIGAFEFDAGGGPTVLVIAAIDHAHAADALGLTQKQLLGVSAADHAHAMDAAPLTQAQLLAVSAQDHAHSLDSLALTQAQLLAIGAQDHVHTVDGLALTQAQLLAIGAQDHAHSLDSLALTQAQLLAISELLRSHGVDNCDVTTGEILVIAAVDRAHTMDAAPLTQKQLLAIGAVDRAHTVDGLALTQAQLLAIGAQDRAHTVDGLALTQAQLLAIGAHDHAHTVDALPLTQAQLLAISAVDRAHPVDNCDATTGILLVVSALLHAHSIDSAPLTQAQLLAVMNSSRAHTVDSVVLGTQITLIISDVLHAHFMGACNVNTGAELEVPGGRIIIIKAESRIIAIAAENRTFNIEG